MSVCTSPIVAAKSAVAAPMIATTVSANGARSKIKCMRSDHVDARGHHGRGVNQRGDRRRAFHGVGQPDIERNLRGLAGGAHQQQSPIAVRIHRCQSGFCGQLGCDLAEA